MFAAIFLQFSSAQTVQPSSPAIHITAYKIDVTLDPAHHSMTAQAVVTFTALQDLPVVSFDLNPTLRVRDITDATGEDLNAARASGTIRVTPSAAMKQGESATWTFTYSGGFAQSADASTDTAADAHLAAIGDPVSYLLYGAQWFPMADYMTDRFTASLQVHVPMGERVLASGSTGPPHPDENGLDVFDFNWQSPGFPGTIVAGKFRGPYVRDANSNVRVYLIEEKSGITQDSGEKYAATAAQLYGDFRSQFGVLTSNQLNVVELPDDTVPAYSAPEITAIAGRQMQAENSSRLLANMIARQWWGNEVSPATLDDAWITDGMCRYAELESLKKNADPAAFMDAVLNISASALAYDTIPLSKVSQYPVMSPEFAAMTYDKGAMIFRMLRWQIGDNAFQQTLRGILGRTDKSISSAEVEKIAEAASHQDLRPFFTQWLDSTGAPNLTDNWTLYRLGDTKGFRTVGEITQDLDLFRMPVDVRVETEGKTVNQRVDVAGLQSQYVIETSGIPRNISLDPERWLLRSGPDMQVRMHILRGQQKAAQKDSAGAIREYRMALKIDDISSLASYRLGEVYFEQRNYQAAANAFRDALHGDDVPKWTEVWSDLELGKIFDATGQRDRAINQYREALQTKDDTGGALELARGYLEHAYAMPSQTAH